MSLHTITVMVRWVVTADSKTCELFDELRTIPYGKREKDPRLVELVQTLKNKWSFGTKIERLATLGWNDPESCRLLSEMLENLPVMREEYADQVKIHGKPRDWDDQDLERFNDAINKYRSRNIK